MQAGTSHADQPCTPPCQVTHIAVCLSLTDRELHSVWICLAVSASSAPWQGCAAWWCSSCCTAVQMWHFLCNRVLEGDIRHVAHDVSWVFNVAVWSRRNCAARLYNKGTNHSNASLDSRCANAFISAGCVMTSCCSTLQMIKSPWLHVRAAKNCWAHTGASWGVVMCWGPITSFLWYCLKSLFFLVWFFKSELLYLLILSLHHSAHNTWQPVWTGADEEQNILIS